MLIPSALALALPNAEPEAQPVEILVEGESLIEFAQIQCENERHGLKPICPHLNTTEDHGCIRCKDVKHCQGSSLTYTVDVKGFDVTGVVSEVDLTFPEINGMFSSPHHISLLMGLRCM